MCLPPMRKPTIWLCKAILLLEYLPAYRRFYTFDSANIDDFLDNQKKPHWRYCPPGRGLWGFHLLDDLGLLWPYLDRYENEEDSDG